MIVIFTYLFCVIYKVQNVHSAIKFEICLTTNCIKLMQQTTSSLAGDVANSDVHLSAKQAEVTSNDQNDRGEWSRSRGTF